jgi:hypothetical protein
VTVEIMPEGVPATDLVRFAEEASQVHGIAKALANTSFVPKVFQGNPHEITAAVLFGRDLGLPPMVALQVIHVIEGKPGLSANAMRGIAMSAGVQFQIKESTETRVIMQARAPGQDAFTSVTWTIDRAKKLGLTGRPNWVKQPQTMLIARATSELCRLVAANVLIGLPYSIEELEDVGQDTPPIPPEPDQPAQPMRQVQRAPKPEMHVVPDPVPEPGDPGEPEVGYDKTNVPKREIEPVPMISSELRRALMARFNDLHIRSRDDRLAKITEIVGREVLSVNTLSDDEARSVLRALDPPTDWPQHAEPPV